MTWTFVLLLVLLIAVAVIAITLKTHAAKGKTDDEPWPLYAKKPLSEPEQVLYHRPVQALPECIVLGQVQLSRFLGVKKGSKRAAWHNRISQKSADFVVCLKDCTVVAVVELDDATHERSARQAADATKNKALESAGVTILRWNVKSLPDEGAIRQAFTQG